MTFVNLNRKIDRHGFMRRGSSSKKSKSKMIKIGAFLLILAVIFYFPVRGIYGSAKALNSQAKAVSQAVKNEDLDAIRSNIKLMRSSVGNLDGSLNWLFWVRVIPYFSGFYADAKHFAKAADSELNAISTIADSLDPYKHELGFNGQPTPGQDRVVQAVKVLDKVIPNLDKVEPQLKEASYEVADIDVNKYPEKIGGKSLRSKIDLAKNFISGAYFAVSQAKPAIQAAPGALGVGNPKNYLIIFQNDKELRATGGFMTAYAFMKLDNGRLSSSKSDDIYRLDEKLLEVCKNVICPLGPPAPIVKYLPEANGKPRSAWSMRDSNISPDLPTSMQNFEKMYSFLKDGEQFDGIIMIDTHVVEELIKITGPIEVFGTSFSAETDKRCNCPNVIFELENYAQVIEKGEADRKAVLGTLMQQILARSLGASTDKLPDFINVGVQLANSKHVMFYMHDQKLADALTQLNWTGQIKETSGDYLHINDSNFAGGKSNLYVAQEVELSIDPDKKTNKLTINYKNPQPYNIWLNGINRDYVRIYLPKGSRLVTSKGSQETVTTIDDELGKTVFEAFIQVRPQNSLVLSFEYQLPQNYTKDGKYPILIQKQPGKGDFKHTVKVNGSTKWQGDLSSDINLSI